MNLTSSSRFIQLTPYALLEFTYNSDVINTKDVDSHKIMSCVYLMSAIINSVFYCNLYNNVNGCTL